MGFAGLVQFLCQFSFHIGEKCLHGLAPAPCMVEIMKQRLPYNTTVSGLLDDV